MEPSYRSQLHQSSAWMSITQMTESLSMPSWFNVCSFDASLSHEPSVNIKSKISSRSRPTSCFWWIFVLTFWMVSLPLTSTAQMSKCNAWTTVSVNSGCCGSGEVPSRRGERERFILPASVTKHKLRGYVSIRILHKMKEKNMFVHDIGIGSVYWSLSWNDSRFQTQCLMQPHAPQYIWWGWMVFESWKLSASANPANISPPTHEAYSCQRESPSTNPSDPVLAHTAIDCPMLVCNLCSSDPWLAKHWSDVGTHGTFESHPSCCCLLE